MADSLKNRVSNYPRFVACIDYIVAQANDYNPTSTLAKTAKPTN
ncbi:MAG: hypothetical protein OXC11_07645 [Rhodospirillales bacterium]|nr:hypothetical protein [Rhodospirillales bacterium]